jgi:transcriptional regulator with XRE-family HTH domain
MDSYLSRAYHVAPMNVPRPSQSAGEKLRKLRLELGLGIREVERRSQRLADFKGNPDYCISRTWLARVEMGEFTPSIYKLHTLSVIYRRNRDEILSYFGLKGADVVRDQSLFGLPKTHLVSPSGEEDAIKFPLRFSGEFEPAQTNLITRLVKIWGDVPAGLLQRLNVRNSLYGYIGLEDYTLHPLILPGSFVQIDPTQAKVQKSSASRELDRPIYFIELHQGYACGWCELSGSRLSVVPHLNSPTPIRHYEYPKEAELVGRVTGVAMRIAEAGVLLGGP